MALSSQSGMLPCSEQRDELAPPHGAYRQAKNRRLSGSRVWERVQDRALQQNRLAGRTARGCRSLIESGD